MEFIEKELAGKQLDPNTKNFGEMMMKMAKMPEFLIKFLLKKKIEDIRAGMGGDPRDITTQKIIIENKTIQGFKRELGIRIYSPEGEATRPLMMFYHGGGWIGGSLKAVEEYCKGVSDQADCMVISVDYHLAPEYPYPEGLEDSYAAIKWAVANKDLLHIDPDQITVSGDSAGGNFSAVLTLMAIERKEFSIQKQILIYPGTDLLISDEPASPDEMPPKVSKAFYSLYVKRGTDMSHPYLSPLHADDFHNLPAALITVGSKDSLYKTSLEYANKLNDAGVPVKFILYKDAVHAFIDDTGNSDQADDFVREAAAFIKQ